MADGFILQFRQKQFLDKNLKPAEVSLKDVHIFPGDIDAAEEIVATNSIFNCDCCLIERTASGEIKIVKKVMLVGPDQHAIIPRKMW